MLKPQDIQFVLVDVQGKLAQIMWEKEPLFRNLEVLTKAMLLLDVPIAWAEQNPARMGPTIPGLSDLLTGLQPLPKMVFSCCGDDGFCRRLAEAGRDDIVLAGIEAHVCVYQTAMDLLARGKRVHVVADAVSSRTAANRELALRRLESAGAVLTCVEMLIFELLKTAEHPRFREILKLVK